ncbi:restriction endonuclease subunit S [Histophilus somni]|uniref:restriction endonuclease subunit S n=1 Tax=Histophilus somni TaxID=731 RepID=UPI003877985E
MFDVSTSKGYDAGKMEFVNKANDTFEFIGRTKENYGVQGFIEKLNTKPNDAETISVSQVGAVHSQIRKNKWYSSQNVFILNPYYKKLINLLVITSIDKILTNYGGYSSYPTLQKLKDHTIQLPSKNGKIDFEFMESFISELEEERISELSAYLTVSGLDNYELSSEEKEALDKFELISNNWNLFKIQDIFNVKSSKKRFDANKVEILNCGFPYIVRMSTNNGIKGYLNQDEQLLNHGNTIAFGQDTATMFYQEKPYFTGDKIKILECRYDKFNKINSMFLISTMRKSFSTFSWGANSFSEKVINNQIIKLPTKNNEIDFSYMELLISAVQKLVIKDVVMWKDKKIEATKQLVGRN